MIYARFLTWLYERQCGYIEIVAGAAEPDRPEKIAMLMNTRRWCYYDPERADLVDQAVAYIGQLASTHGNVYIGCRLYTKAAKLADRRSEAETLPSRVIFLDDAPAAPELPYSASIRTSANSRHAYYKCDRPVTKDDARRAAAAIGGDPSGVDLTQLVRVPGTVNTKHGERWMVDKEPASGAIYPLDQLRALWPAVEPKRPGASITDLAWPAVERHLANIGALLSSTRAQLIKATTQTGRILGGELLSFIVKGKPDNSRSMNACAVALGLLLRGFMDDEIAAVLVDRYREWGSERDKGTAWIKLDIGRCIAYAHDQHPEARQSPTRYRAAAIGVTIAEVLPVSRARSDRPQRFTPAALFAAYQQRPELVDQRRKLRAAGLGISTATLDRLDKELRALGLVAIETDPQRQGSRVILRGVINITPAEVLSAAPATIAPDLPSIGAASGQTAIDQPQCIGETHPPPATPRPAPPLEAGIRAAIVAIEGLEVSSPDTGEIKRRYWRATPDRVRAWLAARWPALDTTAIEDLYPEVRKALRDERQRAKDRAYWQAERANVRTLDNDQLRAALSGWASKLARAEGKQAGSPYAKKCAAHFAIHDDMRRRRGLSEVDAPRDRASRKAATDRTVAVAQALNRPPARSGRMVQLGFVPLSSDPALLRADPTLAAARSRAERTDEQGTRGGACSPLPAVAPVDGMAAIARLKALRDQRTAQHQGAQ